MKYIWYKNSREIVRSKELERTNVYRVTPEYFDDYVSCDKHHEGDLDLGLYTDITSLGNLETVGGYLYLGGALKLTSLGNLRSVGKDRNGSWLNLDDTNVTSLGKLESVNGAIYLRGNVCNLTDLGNLKNVEWDIICAKGSPIYELLMDSKFKEQVFNF